MTSIPSNVPLFHRGENMEGAVKPLLIDESDTVIKFLPKSVRLTLPGHVVRVFPAGLQAIPRVFEDDSWLKANGMQDIKRGMAPPPQPSAPVGSHGYATAFAQSGTYDATTIPDPAVTDENISNAYAAVRSSAENVRMAQEVLNESLRIHQSAVAALIDAQTRRSSLDENRDVALETGSGSGQITRSQQSALDRISEKDRLEGEKSIGIDKLSKEERAKFNAMSDMDKAHFINEDDEGRAVMLAAAPAPGGK